MDESLTIENIETYNKVVKAEEWKTVNYPSYNGSFLENKDPIARVEALMSHDNDLTSAMPPFVFKERSNEPKGNIIQRIEVGSESPIQHISP